MQQISTNDFWRIKMEEELKDKTYRYRLLNDTNYGVAKVKKD